MVKIYNVLIAFKLVIPVILILQEVAHLVKKLVVKFLILVVIHLYNKDTVIVLIKENI